MPVDEVTTLEPVDPKCAVKIHSPEGHQRGIMTLFADEKLCYCIGNSKGEGVCDCLAMKVNETLFYSMQSFYSSLGYKIEPIEV